MWLTNCLSLKNRKKCQSQDEIGAEAAISRQAYYEEECVATDMIIMGTIYQHREARRIRSYRQELKPYIDAISVAIESSKEVSG
jgi:lysine/ornithine N-monooxygenase